MDDIDAVLQAQAAEIARAGHAGWGNTMRDAAADIRALRAAVLAERERGEAVRNAPVIAFLLGDGQLDGVWFGERPEGERGNFWWRKHLRAALDAQPAPGWVRDSTYVGPLTFNTPPFDEGRDAQPARRGEQGESDEDR